MKFKLFLGAVLAFLHGGEVSKIPTVKLHQYMLSILFSSLLCADDQTAEDILIKSLHRMDGINHRFKVDSQESGKKKKDKHFEVSVHWPSEGKLLRQIRVTSILSTRKNPPSFWEHRFKDGAQAKKWMSLPVTGKLKNVTNIKSSKKDFSFTEIEIGMYLPFLPTIILSLGIALKLILAFTIPAILICG